MKTQLDRITRHSEERDELIAMLRMWNKVSEQGIEPEDVARFALLPEFMNRKQIRDFQCLKYAKGGRPVDGRCHPTHANAVRMKDGTTIKLDPWVELP